MEAPFFGKIARIDLTNGIACTQSIDKSVYAKIIGGKGLGAYLLLRYLAAEIDPLSPDNLIVITSGPFTGSDLPCSSRMVAVTKSPLTGTFLDSDAGGYLGREMKRTGWDAIVISGKAQGLTYLLIRNEEIEFKDAFHLQGMSTTATERSIKKELNDDLAQVVCIGPAGENGVLFACLNAGRGRMFGRGGLGAVMGAKNLKAIAIRGTRSLPWNQEKGFREAVKEVHQKLRESPFTGKGGAFSSLGTQFTMEVVNRFGVFPTRNWQKAYFPEVDEIWPQDFLARKAKNVSCYRCPVACKPLTKVEGKEGEVFHVGPEYETIYALGSNCGVTEADNIIQGSRLCEEYGLDSISTGVVLSFIMECYQRGFVTKNDLDGIELGFNRGEEMLEMIARIGKARGVGKLLGQGVSRISKEIGHNSVSFAMAVKHLELPGYDPRGMKTMAVLYATSDRGGCHVRGSTLGDELMRPTKHMDRLSYQGKGILAAGLQSVYALMNSFSVCLFANFALTLEDYAQALNSLFSHTWTTEELKEAGTRIWNLTRVFNCREGFRREDDSLPARLFFDPIPEGPSKGEVIDPEKFEEMLDEYYGVQDWDNEGVPTKETLSRLEINDLV